MGFPGGSAGKESACNAGDLGLIPGLGRSSGEGKGYPLQYSDLENNNFLKALNVGKIEGGKTGEETCIGWVNHMTVSATPWTTQSVEFSRPERWRGQPFPSPGDLPNPGIEPRSPALQEASLPAEPQGKPKNTGVGSLSLLQGISGIELVSPALQVDSLPTEL